MASWCGKAVKKERSQQMHGLVERTGQAERQRFVGTTRPVLWEGQGQPVDDQPGMLLWSGHTDNFLRVLAHAPAEMPMRNHIIPTRLDELHRETLFGSLR